MPGPSPPPGGVRAPQVAVILAGDSREVARLTGIVRGWPAGVRDRVRVLTADTDLLGLDVGPLLLDAGAIEALCRTPSALDWRDPPTPREVTAHHARHLAGWPMPWLWRPSAGHLPAVRELYIPDDGDADVPRIAARDDLPLAGEWVPADREGERMAWPDLAPAEAP